MYFSTIFWYSLFCSIVYFRSFSFSSSSAPSPFSVSLSTSRLLSTQTLSCPNPYATEFDAEQHVLYALCDQGLFALSLLNGSVVSLRRSVSNISSIVSFSQSQCTDAPVYTMNIALSLLTTATSSATSSSSSSSSLSSPSSLLVLSCVLGDLSTQSIVAFAVDDVMNVLPPYNNNDSVNMPTSIVQCVDNVPVTVSTANNVTDSQKESAGAPMYTMSENSTQLCNVNFVKAIRTTHYAEFFVLCFDAANSSSLQVIELVRVGSVFELNLLSVSNNPCSTVYQLVAAPATSATMYALCENDYDLFLYRLELERTPAFAVVSTLINFTSFIDGFVYPMDCDHQGNLYLTVNIGSQVFLSKLSFPSPSSNTPVLSFLSSAFQDHATFISYNEALNGVLVCINGLGVIFANDYNQNTVLSLGDSAAQTTSYLVNFVYADEYSTHISLYAVAANFGVIIADVFQEWSVVTTTDCAQPLSLVYSAALDAIVALCDGVHTGAGNVLVRVDGLSTTPLLTYSTFQSSCTGFLNPVCTSSSSLLWCVSICSSLYGDLVVAVNGNVNVGVTDTVNLNASSSVLVLGSLHDAQVINLFLTDSCNRTTCVAHLYVFTAPDLNGANVSVFLATMYFVNAFPFPLSSSSFSELASGPLCTLRSISYDFMVFNASSLFGIIGCGLGYGPLHTFSLTLLSDSQGKGAKLMPMRWLNVTAMGQTWTWNGVDTMYVSDGVEKIIMYDVREDRTVMTLPACAQISTMLVSGTILYGVCANSQQIFTIQLPISSSTTSSFSSLSPPTPPGTSHSFQLTQCFTPSALVVLPSFSYFSSSSSSASATSSLPPALYIACANGVFAFAQWTCTGGFEPTQGGRFSCTPCPRGKAKMGSVQQGCSQCERGKITDQVGSLRCSACLPGQYASNPAASYCSNCAPGKFSSTSGASTCNFCPPYTFASEPMRSICDTCNSSVFSGSLSCVPCLGGSFLNVSMSSNSDTSSRSACMPCAAGSYSTTENVHECIQCPKGKAQQLSGSTRCFDCAAGQYADVPGLSVCRQCPPGTVSSLSSASTTCVACAPGSYNNQSTAYQCLDCLLGTFALNSGSVQCTPCANGASCSSTGVFVLPGYWASLSLAGDLLTYPCSTQFCVGANLQNQCLPGYDPNSTLCGTCLPGHSRWGNSCLLCPDASFGIITAFVILCCIYVIFVHVTSQSVQESALVEILLYYIQTCIVISGPSWSWLSWVSLLNLSPSSSSPSTIPCPAPLNGYQHVLLELLMSPMMLTFLLLFLLVHAAASKVLSCVRERVPFKRTAYARSACALFLFGYTQISLTCLQFLKCISAGTVTSSSRSVSVVFTSPDISCDDDRYRQWYAAMVSIVVVVVVGVPMTLMCLFIVKRKEFRQDGMLREQFAFLTESYSEAHHYWKLMILFRRLIIVLISTQLISSIQWKPVLYFLSHFLFVQVDTHLRPYASLIDNVVSISLLSLLVCLSVLLSAAPAPYDEWEQVLVAIMILLPTMTVMAIKLSNQWETWKKEKTRKQSSKLSKEQGNREKNELREHQEKETISLSPLNLTRTPHFHANKLDMDDQHQGDAYACGEHDELKALNVAKTIDVHLHARHLDQHLQEQQQQGQQEEPAAAHMGLGTLLEMRHFVVRGSMSD